MVWPERALTRSGEPAKRKMTTTPEPTDKLDAATPVAVNGPADETLQICERIVRRHAIGSQRLA